MEDDNEDNLKNKEDLHIAGRHTALDIFRFAVFFNLFVEFLKNSGHNMAIVREPCNVDAHAIKCRLPSKVFFHQRLSSIKGRLPSRVVFH